MSLWTTAARECEGGYNQACSGFWHWPCNHKMNFGVYKQRLSCARCPGEPGREEGGSGFKKRPNDLLASAECLHKRYFSPTHLPLHLLQLSHSIRALGKKVQEQTGRSAITPRTCHPQKGKLQLIVPSCHLQPSPPSET